MLCRETRSPKLNPPSIMENSRPSSSMEDADYPQSTPVSPRKRSSPRKSRAGSARPSSIMTSPSKSPRKSTAAKTLKQGLGPLSDITAAALNEKPLEEAKEEEANTKETPEPLKSPIDVVIRSRATIAKEVEDDGKPHSRMVIKYLVLNNFKSYAGRQMVGPFHSSFSSVVGPNGSGKSNVIDSLLFVFGFRASKMRQGKVSALIHNSASHPDLDYCEVEVHFQEVIDTAGGQTEIVPESDMIVSRKAFKNNSSKYYLNGRESNFTTVTTLLRDKGIDLDHKRFLILQGEVESIAQMKPKAMNEHDDGLLEYLEDIIGTSKYKTPIEQAAAEVETLNEVCIEKASRVQHVEKEKNSLEETKNKALAFVQDENELKLKQSALYQVYLEECDDNLKVTEEALVEVKKQLEEENGKTQENQDQIKGLKSDYKKAEKQFEALQTESQVFFKEITKLEKEAVKYEEKKKFLTQKQKKLEKALQTSNLSKSEAKSLIQKHSDDIERNTAEIASLEADMETETNELFKIRESLKGKTQAFSDKIAAKQKELEPWTEKITTKESSIAVMQSELEILRERVSAGQVALDELKAKKVSVQENRKTKLAEKSDLVAQQKTLKKDISKAEAELQELVSAEQPLKGRLVNARQKADEARASLASSQSQGNVLNGLMRLKNSGRIEGFYGRLGDLGAIDKKYDVAISTACPALDNLVVDTVEVGQSCIDYLRKNNLGRAKFIILDRQPSRDMSPVTTPEDVPRLFDLVKAKDKKFHPAFYSVLQNTLVADNLEQANRIAYGARRWRVVTLDGQLIDTSGTMSGGGTRVARGGMSSHMAADTTADQVTKLESGRDDLESQYNALQTNIKEQESVLKELKSRGPKLDVEMNKIELELKSIDRNLADIDRRTEELKAEDQSSETETRQIKKLEKDMAAAEADLAKLHSQTAGLEQEIKELQDKIMEVGGVKLRSQKAKVDGLKEQISMLSNELSSAELSKSKATKDVEKHEKNSQQTAKDLETAVKDLDKLSQEDQSRDSDFAAARQKADQAQSAIDDKKEDLENIKKTLDAMVAELNESRGLKLEIENKLEENQKILAENQKRHRHWSDKLEKLSLQSLSEFGEEEAAQELPKYTRDELLDMDKDALNAEIAVLEEKTDNVNVDLNVLDEYRKRVQEHEHRSSDLQTAVSSRDAAKSRCDDLRKLRLEGFMEGFRTISLRLKEMYQMITMGGNAELELVDSLDPFSEGILFSVMPPKKSWKNISNLSGGEKTLSSLALVFALHHYKPTPLYVMDEIDAALDFRNVSIVANYIKERTKNAQFIVISLRNNMFELASRLVGVYKVNHMTKSVTVENKDYFVRR